MKLLVTGLNHRSAPVEVREKVAFPELSLADALADLKRCSGFLEGLILSTCNRVEIVLAADDDCEPHGLIRNFLRDARILLATIGNLVIQYVQIKCECRNGVASSGPQIRDRGERP